MKIKRFRYTRRRCAVCGADAPHTAAGRPHHLHVRSDRHQAALRAGGAS